MKRALPFVILLFVLFAPSAFADNAPSYVELTDAPTITVDWSKATTQAVTLDGNRALIFTNGRKGGKYMLIIKQDATGGRIPTFPPTVHCAGGTCPTLTTTANKKDYISFFCDGATYDALSLSQNF